MISLASEPNHVCKYSKCTLGKNGSPKRYYACGDCDKYNSWKSMGCCFEHFMLYGNEVAVSRGKEIPFPEIVDTNLTTSVKVENIKEVELTDIELDSDTPQAKEKTYKSKKK